MSSSDKIYEIIFEQENYSKSELKCLATQGDIASFTSTQITEISNKIKHIAEKCAGNYLGILH